MAAVEINELINLGVGGVVGLMLIAVLAQIGLSYLGQRNLNDQLSLGMQAVTGANNIQVVNNQQENDGGVQGGN
jgi:hypothetical protein